MKVINRSIISLPAHTVDAELMAVLTKDDVGLFAVYLGIVPRVSDHTLCDQMEQAYWVAHRGQKLTWSKARAYFHIEEKEYRA